MDRREMEKLMDRYKAEMLEFSRRNNTSGYPKSDVSGLDERERSMSEALENREPFERDRSNPLPAMPEQPPEPVQPIEAEPEAQPQAVPAQVEMPLQEAPIVRAEQIDVARMLRENCARLAGNPTPEQRERCRDINDFLVANNESGTMRVEAFAADRSFGIGSARVMIFVELPSGNVAVFDGLTDIDGVTQSIRLPAPPRELSQSPQTGANARLPYSVYSVYVEHPAFVRAVFTNVPVFSGVESIQPVRMLAKSAGTSEPEPIVVDETNANTLRRNDNGSNAGNS